MGESVWQSDGDPVSDSDQCHERPHPGPLPRGEGESFSVSGVSKAGDSSEGSVESKAVQRLSPLPGGEGQGEGERNTKTNQFEPPHVVSYKEALEKKILANLKPEELGLRFEPVREQALKAAAESQDFGGLFLGFSFFVIGAALLLMALLFSLGLEQRAPEIGTLLALGFTPKQVRSLLLREGVALAFLGGVIGALGGLAYAKAMLHGLTTIWRDAVGASALSFHFTAQTLVIGLFASVVVSVVTIWLTLRKFVKRPARELLVGEIGTTESKVQSLKSKVIAVGALLAGVALAGWAVVKGDTANAGIFFGAGALVLVAGLSFASTWLAQLGRSAALRAGASSWRTETSRVGDRRSDDAGRPGGAWVRAAAEAESGDGGDAGVREFSDRVHRRVPAGCKSRCDEAHFRHGRLCAHRRNHDAGGAGFEFAGRGGSSLR